MTLRPAILLLGFLSLAAPALAQTTLEVGAPTSGGSLSTGAGFSIVGSAGQLQPVGIAAGAESIEGGLWYTPSADTDGDGWPDSLDCDPADPTISPSGFEIADDGIDQDCNGVDATDCFIDDDGDTFGSLLMVTALDGDCVDVGESGVDTDCDDTDGTTYPGATELCDAIDSDCDGDLVDGDPNLDGDALPDCIDDDADGDGVSVPADCDDLDAGIYPGNQEIVGDGIDQNCDGSDAAPCLEDLDMDGYGGLTSIISTNGSCTAPGETLTAGDCDDTDPGISPVATEIVDDGVDQDCNGTDTVSCFDDQDGDAAGGSTPVLSTDGECFDLGESETSDDCDDSDPSVYPGAPEVLDDGVDQDCSGADSVSCWVDGDGDGYGTGAVDVVEGPCPAGSVGAGGDCDESDALVNPGMAELCNDGVDDDCDASTDENIDGDGDGWTSCEGDCAEGDSLTYPDAVEQCDDVDNDCDPLSEPDESDEDEDNARICDGDCDDADPTAYPDAPELCDEIDNDCDGAAETDDEVTNYTWYFDADGDGFGDIDTPHPDGPTCELPDVGFVTNGDDCDDVVSIINPDAIEICDGIDNDCDILTTLGGTDVDADEDGSLACEPADPDSLQDCDDDDPFISPEAVEVCDDGVDNDCNRVIDGEDAQCSGTGCAGCAANQQPASNSPPMAWMLLLGLVGLSRRRRRGPRRAA